VWEEYKKYKGSVPAEDGPNPQFFFDAQDTTIEKFEAYYGQEIGKVLYLLGTQYPQIDIEKTEQQDKQNRLQAIWDDREGELFPELSFFNNTINERQSRSNNMNGVVFSDTLQTAIDTGNWTEETLQELDNIVNTQEYGKLLSQRFPQEVGSRITGILAKAELLISGGYENSNSPKFRDRLEHFQLRQSEGKKQEAVIESWAKEEGIWFNDYTDKKAKPYSSLESMLSSEYEESYGGSESLVYIDREHKEIIKAVSLLHSDDNPQIALDRIVLHNQLFPNTAYSVIGFGRDSLGQFRVIVKQKFIQGENTSVEEISKFAETIGLKEEQGWWYSSDDLFRITDLSPLNVLTDVNGKLQVIDCDIELISQSSQQLPTQEVSFSSSLNNSISTGVWTEETINELNDLIDKIENGTITYQRFPQEASEGFHRGGRIHEAASIILRGSGETDSAKPLSFNERYERDKRQQPVQEKIIEDWAKAQGTDSKVDVLKIADKTAAFGVEILPALTRNYQKWQQEHPNGIIAYRLNYRIFNTPENVEKGIIGNPFDWQKYGEENSLQMFYDWLTTGNNFNEPLANEEYRQAIIQRILSTETPQIAYYKEKGQPSHATVLGYLIQNKQLLQPSSSVWFDNLDNAVQGKKQIGEGGEAKVFYDGNGTVTKLITTEYFITPQFALDRITLHNTLFPEAPLTLKGFGRNKDGQFVFVVDQPFIEGTTPTMQEIQEFMENAGFKKTTEKGNTYTNESVYLSDLHDENVIKTPQGNLVVIDVDARLNTAELGKGGTYVTDNTLEETAPI